jgi:hypothetical protein
MAIRRAAETGAKSLLQRAIDADFIENTEENARALSRLEFLSDLPHSIAYLCAAAAERMTGEGGPALG